MTMSVPQGMFLVSLIQCCVASVSFNCLSKGEDGMPWDYTASHSCGTDMHTVVALAAGDV